MGTVIKIDDPTFAVGADYDVRRALRKLLEVFPRETHLQLPLTLITPLRPSPLAARDQPMPCSASQRSASIAAMQPVPAAVTAWR